MTSNLNLEIANLALNINQTTKEEIGEMITEECQDKYALKDHGHDSFDTLTINKDIMIPNEEADTGYTLLKSGAFYSYDKDRQIDCTLDGIHIHNFPGDKSTYIGPGSINVNGNSVSLEGHTHDYAASNHTHITDLEMPEVDTSNLATKEELAGKANTNHTHSEYAEKNHTHSTYDAAYERVNELKGIYSWNTGYNGTGTQTTANIIANGGLTVNNKAVSMEGHTHVFEKLTFENENYISGISPTAINIGHKDGDVCDRGLQITRDGGILIYEERGGRLQINYNGILKSSSEKGTSMYLTKNELIDLFYPVGSIYTSMNSTSPATIFGGTWTQITDRFLYCANSSKATGGDKKIKVENLPAHNHEVNITSSDMSGDKYGRLINATLRDSQSEGRFIVNQTNNSYKGGSDRSLFNIRLELSHTHNVMGATGNTGSGTDYMPPYITIYAWYRTA